MISVEGFFLWFNSFFLESDSDALCRIRSVVSDDTFTTTSDDIYSVIRIMGSKTLVGETEVERMAQALDVALASAVRSGNGKQHGFSVGFRSNPKGAKSLLTSIFAPLANTASRMGVGNMAMFDDRRSTLAKVCVDETVYLIAYTLR